jgi:hypothetical protein
VTRSYPIVFAVITLPLSIVRFRSGFGSIKRNYPTWTFVVEFVYSLSGALNVLLFLFTRSDLLLPRNRLGVAPSLAMSERENELTTITESTVNSRPRSRGHAPAPVGSLPSEDDLYWRLPARNRSTDLHLGAY